jgi:hypothetical protein
MMYPKKWEELIQRVKSGDSEALVEILKYLYNSSINCEGNVKRALNNAGEARQIAEELKNKK